MVTRLPELSSIYGLNVIEPLSAATIHGHVRTLRASFSWLVTEGFAEADIARDLKPPKVPIKVMSTLFDEEIQAVITSFNPARPLEARNQTIFMLLIDTGLRIGGACESQDGRHSHE